MHQVESLDEIKSLIQKHRFALLYITRADCSVCHSLLPQIEQVLEHYPMIQSIRVDANAVPEIAGEYTIFTVPAILAFIDGKEMIRKARFIPMDEFKYELSKYDSLFE